MPAVSKKIVESGLHPKPAPTLEGKVLEYTDEICMAFIATVRESLIRIKEAERTAIARLNEYVPNEPLMTRPQAAAYLNIKLRQLDVMTRPGSTEIPFNKIGGLKRFRKVSLDSWLDRTEVRRAEVRL